jgi:acyl carrier protein
MTFDEVLNQVNGIFIKVLGQKDLILKYDTTADQVEDWDSLTHIELIVAIEKHFKIKLSLVEVQGFKNVGEMCTVILKKVNVNAT